MTESERDITPREYVLAALLTDCRQGSRVWLADVVELAGRYLVTDYRFLRATTLELVREMISVKWMTLASVSVVGDEYTDVPWDLPLKCALDRIANEWTALGRNPKLGEIIYFTGPDPDWDRIID